MDSNRISSLATRCVQRHRHELRSACRGQQQETRDATAGSHHRGGCPQPRARRGCGPRFLHVVQPPLRAAIHGRNRLYAGGRGHVTAGLHAACNPRSYCAGLVRPRVVHRERHAPTRSGPAAGERPLRQPLRGRLRRAPSGRVRTLRAAHGLPLRRSVSYVTGNITAPVIPGLIDTSALCAAIVLVVLWDRYEAYSADTGTRRAKIRGTLIAIGLYSMLVLTVIQ